MPPVSANRRYYLHRRIKKNGLSYSIEDGSIYLTERQFDDLKPKHRRYIGELVSEYGYQIQLLLFKP